MFEAEFWVAVAFLLFVLVLLLFGRGKISELMGDMAQGIKAFKKGMSEDEVAKTDAAPKTIDQTATPPAPAATAQPQAAPRKLPQGRAPDRADANHNAIKMMHGKEF